MQFLKFVQTQNNTNLPMLILCHHITTFWYPKKIASLLVSINSEFYFKILITLNLFRKPRNAQKFVKIV